ncbi:DUF1702 family protein [Nocardia yamanashiensis]|uniref:DUF1702 family protein n=1 Tax=Nocardia yamanashiensis TaxID=209247 RepID=UPI001E53AB4B|nr:DUF1702 family protein [Nocardia yamanashiensis]UGT41927.1 DUF1702 family protein [Nocardia yamanashiensis]
MATLLTVARHLVPAPTMNDMKFAARGFPAAANEVSRRFEGVSRAVLEGFEYGADIDDPDEVARRLEWVDPRYRSLAYEGAIAAMTLRDLLALGRTDRAEEFTRTHGEPHSLMAYVGYGLVMSRLPRPLWRRAMPRFDSNPLVARLGWLAVDGYGFDRAFFDPRRWIVEHRRPPRYPWAGAPDYFPRAFDQGVGRALSFYYGGDCAAVADAVEAFEPDRRGDLWSGIGAAATYIGGQPAAELEALLARAGAHAPDLAIGAVMAVKARHYAGWVPESAELGAELFCRSDVAEISAFAEAAAEAPAEPGAVPDYEQWRLRIRARFADLEVRS